MPYPLSASRAGATPTLSIFARYAARAAECARLRSCRPCQPVASMPKSTRPGRVPSKACKPASKNKARVMGASKPASKSKACKPASKNKARVKKSCATKSIPTAEQACKQAVQAAGCHGTSGHAQSTQRGSLKVKQHVLKEQNCPDKQWDRWGCKWQAGPGSHVWSGSGKPSEKVLKLVWLQRKKDITGKMNVGCSLCSWFSDMQLDKTKVSNRRHKRWNSKWTRFEVNKLMQSSQIRLHASSDMHCLAFRCWRQPPEAQMLWVESTEQIELLKGNVPQPADWLKLWRQVKSSSLSYRSISMLSYTDSFIHSGRGDLTQITNAATGDMVRIMVDVVRDGKRKDLREAEAIALSSDDKSNLCCKKLSDDVMLHRVLANATANSNKSIC